MSSLLLYGLVVMLASALPFEFLRPVVSRRWFDFTNLDLIIAGAAVVWILRMCIKTMQGRQRLFMFDWGWYSPFIWPAFLFFLLATLSALLASANQVDALKSVARFVSGLCAFFLVIQVSRSLKRWRGLLWAMVAGAGLSALLGLGQKAGLSSLDQFLSLFAATPTLAAGDLRVSATFGHANIASAFFEMAVPLALAVAATSRSKSARIVAAAIAIVCSLVIVLTMSRTGLAMIAVFFGLALLLGQRYLQWRLLFQPALAATVALVGVTVVLLLTSPSFQMRLTTMSDEDWYGAIYNAPSSLQVQDLDGVLAEIEVRNTGSFTWKATGDRSFVLGYRWLSEDGKWVLGLPHSEVALPADVGPGEGIRLAVPLEVVLPPGDYRLAWGMLQRDTVWFHYREVPDAETAVHIAPDITDLDSLSRLLPPTPRDDPQRKPLILSRSELWDAALRMVADRPLLGVGPGNFRHLHGRYLGLTNWNRFLHAHNLYLELLADLGVLGAASFGLFLLSVVICLVRILRAPGAEPTLIYALGLSGSVIAFLLHGLVDYFLGFASVHFFFWIVLGLIVALARLERFSFASGHSALKKGEQQSPQQ